MSKSHLSEEDIKARYITPAVTNPGWDIHSQVRFEYPFTAGRIIVRGQMTARGSKKRADYMLSYKSNLPLVINEILLALVFVHGNFYLTQHHAS